MNRGFTLIELMVVVVIIGVLSAVAAPKLFSLSARAKAAEISPAVVSFERLEKVYYSETAEFGDLDAIGWVTPKSKYFTYSMSETEPNAIFEVDLKLNLGNCATSSVRSGDTWRTTIEPSLRSTRENPSASSCVQLTQNFPMVL